jgi:hypothetical protein
MNNHQRFKDVAIGQTWLAVGYTNAVTGAELRSAAARRFGPSAWWRPVNVLLL